MSRPHRHRQPLPMRYFERASRVVALWGQAYGRLVGAANS